MNCPSCAFSNAPGARFCGWCGSHLSAVCAHCGAELVAELRFCTACGEALTAPAVAVAPAAERRQVSVLFLDLEGFTPLAESLDPEEVRELQSRYFESVRATVARFGGSLEKFIGDAVMAVWGTPVAHEDDAERAVRAALEIVGAVSTTLSPSGAPLTARAAVTTGEAAVALGVRDEGMVSGDLVNTAARLQAVAPGGAVLVDAATRQVIGRSVVTAPAGEHLLKGKSAAVAAWRATGVAIPERRSTDPGHRGPFVGRETELSTLRGTLASVIRDGRLRIVSLTGIAGIGKSRLSWELEHLASEFATPPAWHTARAPAYGDGVAFAPLAAIVRGVIGATDTDPGEVVERALGATLARLVPDGAERDWLEVRMLALLEPQSGHAHDRDELFAAWRRFLSATAASRPLVLVFEDLQWADSGLLAFIEYLADWSRHDPILVVTLGRPELLDARPTWGAGLQHFTAVHVDRLPDEAIDALLSALAPELGSDMVSRVRQRADGVPLYAVEMARMLAEHGDDGLTYALEVDVPPSLHALIAARIDALPPADRSLLLTAAVLGRRFRIEMLRWVTDQDVRSGIQALVRREFLAVDDDPRSPGRGQLTFVQELVREVAYGTLSRAERRLRHLRVVEVLERAPDGDHAEPIAEHLLAAHRAGGSHDHADAVRGRAVAALRRAAERAAVLHAPDRAMQHYDDAVSLSGDPPLQAEMLEAAAIAARAAARFEAAEERLRHASRLRAEIGDVAGAARDGAQLAALLLQAQRSGTALAELEAAWSDVARAPDEASMLEIPAQLARAHLLRGATDEAISWARRALGGTSQSAGGKALTGVELDAAVTLGTALVQDGQVDEGMATLHSAVKRAREASLGSVELRALNNMAWLVAEDDPRATYDAARAGYDLAIRTGNREMALQLLDGATVVAVDTGDWRWAIAAIDEAESGPLPAVYRLDIAATRVQLAAMRGDEDLGERLAALEEHSRLPDDVDQAARSAADYARAIAALAAGDLAAAQAAADRAAAASVEFELPRALALAGRLAAWNGDVDAARRTLAALEAIPSDGRTLIAARSALRASLGWLAEDGRQAPGADAASSDALATWRLLKLPLREAFTLLDRARLRADDDATSRAAAILDALGARALAGLLPARPVHLMTNGEPRHPRGRM